jgi:hypothetical protein
MQATPVPIAWMIAGGVWLIANTPWRETLDLLVMKTLMVPCS